MSIDEIRENPGITAPLVTAGGHWLPSTIRDYNYRCGGGVSGIYWFCDRQRIRAVPAQSLPQPLEHFKTFSIFYCAGLGFWVLHGDGTAPHSGSAWRPLRFDLGPNGSSYMTPAGNKETLLCQRTDQLWAHKLLPNIYHGPQTQHPGQGGLCGELPIFLALAALSMQPHLLQQWLPWMFQDSKWHMHSLPHGWQHGRGVVVNVYTCPSSWAEGSSKQDLVHFEDGDYGKYCN
ncbi:hypothetical protein DE146DRAFT_626770 [Phaeosphaeria sp. MPI-PUGE-AT-0046c]|nr:hypothetical protein DE146DRAFT_626770 [Phaeosphaeria sp. MPI-PUGE-AT-0046c]